MREAIVRVGAVCTTNANRKQRERGVGKKGEENSTERVATVAHDDKEKEGTRCCLYRQKVECIFARMLRIVRGAIVTSDCDLRN